MKENGKDKACAAKYAPRAKINLAQAADNYLTAYGKGEKRRFYLRFTFVCTTFAAIFQANEQGLWRKTKTFSKR
ncbi:MAG: hypothetical protein LUI08_05370 [Prevotella sp.]|nr:hypothetical protein [Prevotella sp.]MCD8306478.1 hypothetical protein [Prevotella sp.]